MKTRKVLSALLGVAALMAVMSASAGEVVARTVSVRNVVYQSGIARSAEVVVAAGSQAVVLCAASDVVDRGTDINDWSSSEIIAASVPASETETVFTYEFKTGDDLVSRFFACSIMPPFKYQLDHLKSTGSQYLLLGSECPTQKWRIETEMSVDEVGSSSLGFWGSRRGAGNSAFLMLYDSGTKRFRFDVAGSLTGQLYQNDVTLGQRYTFTVSQSEGVCVDGVKKGDVGTGSFTSSCPLSLFAFNDNGTVKCLSKASVHSFRVWTNAGDESSLLYDLVPCVMNDGTVTFYNAVNKSFLPVTSGTFSYASEDIVPATIGDLTALSSTETVNLTAENRRISASQINRSHGTLSARLTVTSGVEPYRVLVAYGAADADETLGKWDSCASLGMVAADATSFEAELPFAWSDGVKYARFFLCYGTEELGPRYLESTGTQYIVTDYTATSKTKVEAHLAFIDTASSIVMLWTGRTAVKNSAFGALLQSNALRLDYGSSLVDSSMKPAQGERLRTLTQSGRKLTLDSYPALEAQQETFTAGAPLTFFALNSNGTVTNPSRVRFTEVKVWDDCNDADSLKLHLLPAVRDSKAGFLNVLENGKFYPNTAGGDDFVMGYSGVHPLDSSVTHRKQSGLVLFLALIRGY